LYSDFGGFGVENGELCVSRTDRGFAAKTSPTGNVNIPPYPANLVFTCCFGI